MNVHELWGASVNEQHRVRPDGLTALHMPAPSGMDDRTSLTGCWPTPAELDEAHIHVLRTLAVYIVESCLGYRSPDQLSRWLSTRTSHVVYTGYALARERARIGGVLPPRPAVTTGSVRVFGTYRGLLDVVITLRLLEGVRAMTMQLEHEGSRMRVRELFLL